MSHTIEAVRNSIVSKLPAGAVKSCAENKGWTGFYLSDLKTKGPFFYINQSKKDQPRWITTSVEIPGRPSKIGGAVKAQFRSDDLEAIALMVAALAGKPTNSLLEYPTEEELETLAPL